MTKEEQLQVLASVISESADSFFKAKVNKSGTSDDSGIDSDIFGNEDQEYITGGTDIPKEEVDTKGFDSSIPLFTDKEAPVHTNSSLGEKDQSGGAKDSQGKRNPSGGTKSVDFTTEGEFDNIIKPKVWSDAIKKQCQEVRDKDEKLKKWSDELVSALLPYATKELMKAQEMAYKDPRTNKHCEDKIAFKKDTCVVNGKPMEFTRVMQLPDWEMDLKECLSNDDRAYNFDQIRIKITQSLYDYYGGFTRFNNIVVSGYQLIINGSCYMPKLSKAVIEKFPFDTIEYIRNGCIAPFLDWGYLRKMKNLSVLSIDDADFVSNYIIPDLGVKRDFTPLDLFVVCKSLNTLEIGGEVITYPFDGDEAPEDVKKSARRVKEDAEYSSRMDRVYNAYTDKVCGTVGNVRKWTVGNLVNYANNRNNKNIFMYTGGIIARTAVSAVVGTGELTTRAAGGIVHGIARVIKGAVSSVHNGDSE